MDLTTLLVALPTIFMAAFLATLLENARERLRTRKWVVRNLRALAGAIAEIDLGHWPVREKALARWLSADSSADMDETTWEQIHFLVISAMPDIGTLVRSEAAAVVSEEIFRAVHELESAGRELTLVEQVLHASFVRDVLPLWCERRAPLTGADARRIAKYRDVLISYRQRLHKAKLAADRFRTVVDSRRWPRRWQVRSPGPTSEQM